MMMAVLIIHLILALSIIALVLMQNASGGLGSIGGQGGLGDVATPRSAANFMTRATTICAICFFGTSLVLAILSGAHSNQDSVLDQIAAESIEITEQLPIEIPTVPVGQ